MKKIVFFLCMVGSLNHGTFAQTTTASSNYLPSHDYHNVSIATIPSMDMAVVGGSTHNPTSNVYKGCINFHEVGGVLIQGIQVDIPGYTDVKVLDICTTPNGLIAITGVVRSGPSTSEDYAFYAMFDFNSNMLLHKVFTLENFATPNIIHSAGTEIIYNSNDNSFIIGGLMGSQVFSESSIWSDDNMTSFVLKINASSNTLDWVRGFQGNTGSAITNWGSVFNVVNELTLINNNQVFVTGNLSRVSEDPMTGISGDTDGVLAMSLDLITGNITKDYSFFSTTEGGHYQTGASATYSANQDRLLLLSNNAQQHNPEVSVIQNVSNPALGTIISNRVIGMNGHGPSNPTGLSIEYVNPNVCRVSGSYMSDGGPLAISGSTPYWTTLINVNTHLIPSNANVNRAEIYRKENSNYQFTGDGIFGMYNSQYVRIPNDPMTIYNPDLSLHIVPELSPSSNYGYQMISNESTSMDCLESQILNVNIFSVENTNCDVFQTPINPLTLPVNVASIQMSENNEFDVTSCISNNLLRKGQANEIEENINESIFQLLENPVTDNIVVLVKEAFNSNFELFDNLGKRVSLSSAINTGESYKISVEGLPKGTYFLKCSNGDITEVLKVVI